MFGLPNHDPLDLIKAHLVAPAIVVLRCARRGVIGHRRRLFQRPAVLEIVRDPARSSNASKSRDERGGMQPEMNDRVVGKFAAALALGRGYLAYSMGTTLITATALKNGAQFEDVQKAAGHRDPRTTKLYDRVGIIRKTRRDFFAALSSMKAFGPGAPKPLRRLKSSYRAAQLLRRVLRARPSRWGSAVADQVYHRLISLFIIV